jgi:hypothetical protein
VVGFEVLGWFAFCHDCVLMPKRAGELQDPVQESRFRNKDLVVQVMCVVFRVRCMQKKRQQRSCPKEYVQKSVFKESIVSGERQVSQK